MYLGTALLLLGLLGGTPILGHDKFWYPVRQAVDINTINGEQFLQIIQQGGTVVIHFTVPKTDDPVAQEMDRINDQMIQMAAQSLHIRNVTFARINMVDNKNVVEQAGVKDVNAVLILANGRKHIYSGHRSAEALISFVNKMESPIVRVIQSKMDKKAFDYSSSSKVVGYFQAWPTNQEMVAFEAAASTHFPDTPFYAVITAEMALSMKFNAPGEIHVVRPFEKNHIVIPQNPATEMDITSFLEAEGRPILRRVTLEDLHSVWPETEEDKVVAFIRENSPDGKALAKTFKNMAKYGLLRNATDRTILLIDPDNFPVLVDHWQTLFNFDLTMPALGLLNITDNTASWADLTAFSTMNTTDQIALVTLWLEAVSTGRVRVDGTVPVPTQAELESIAKEATEMALRAMEAARRASQAAEAATKARVSTGDAVNEPVASTERGDSSGQSDPTEAKVEGEPAATRNEL